MHCTEPTGGSASWPPGQGTHALEPGDGLYMPGGQACEGAAARTLVL